MKKLLLAMMLVASMGLIGCASSTTTDSDSTETAESVFEGEYVVSPEYVAENLEDIILIDARGIDASSDTTIEGAMAVSWQYLATCEDGATGDEYWGCILDTDRLSERLSELGIDPEKEIVLFGASQAGWGDDGRIAWELIAAGYENVKIVDGGYDMLVAAGLETQKGASTYDVIEVVVEEIDETHVINTTELEEVYDNVVVIDVRADEEYDGGTLYGEANGGHLPDAIHIRFTDLFQDNGLLKSNEEITAMFEEAGLSTDDTIVTYCTAGIRSAYMQLILEMCGYEDTMNYDESFYRWCAVNEVE